MLSRRLTYVLRLTLLLWFAVVGWSPLASSAEAWSRFRGPNGCGESESRSIPAVWDSTDYGFRVALPGTGHSSPVVCGDQLFIVSADEQDATRMLRCLKRGDGSLIWKRSFESSTHTKHRLNNYDASTPAADEKHVYLAWATPEEYTLLAVDREKGRDVWRRDLGPYSAQHGYGASPIVFEDLVIAPNDQNAKSFAVALDAATGQTRWKTDLPIKKGGYATPCIYREGQGPPQLIMAGSAYGLISLDPCTGRKHWDIELFDDRVVASPTIAGGLILTSCGEGGRGTSMFAVRPGDPRTGRKPEVAYELKGSLPYVCTPVARRDLLFVWYDLGVVTCIDAPSGKIHWQERVGGNYFCSPIRVADRIYCASRDGEMVVLAAEKEFKLLGRIDLEEPTNATPAVSGGVMYLRTATHLMALGGER